MTRIKPDAHYEMLRWDVIDSIPHFGQRQTQFSSKWLKEGLDRFIK